MPNYCDNSLYIQGNAERLKELTEELFVEREGNYELTFDKIKPMPKELIDEGWYEWRVGNWGTKWDADCYRYYSADDLQKFADAGEISVSFATAWEAPLGFLQTLAEKYDDLLIECHFIEEGCEICGTFTSDEQGIRAVNEDMVYTDEDGIIVNYNHEDGKYYYEDGTPYDDEDGDCYPTASHPINAFGSRRIRIIN